MMLNINQKVPKEILLNMSKILVAIETIRHKQHLAMDEYEQIESNIPQCFRFQFFESLRKLDSSFISSKNNNVGITKVITEVKRRIANREIDHEDFLNCVEPILERFFQR